MVLVATETFYYILLVLPHLNKSVQSRFQTLFILKGYMSRLPRVQLSVWFGNSNLQLTAES